MGSAEHSGGSDSTLAGARHGAPDTHLDRSPVVVVPAVLPHAVVTVDDGGHARIVVENIDHHAGIVCPERPISRDELGGVLAGIAEQIGGPVRVEVREADGARYADILQPRAPEPPENREPSEPATEPVLTGEGFLPSETVLVAVVVTTIQAQADGTASLTALPPTARPGGRVILFGGASGRIVQRQLPTTLVARKRRWWR